jgi:putative ABC transport system substrate-binding protein
VATKPAAQSAAAAADKVWSVGIFQLTSHPALDACANGIVKALADNGFAEGKNVKIDRQNAQGDIPTLTTIAQKFVDARVDVIVADSTPALLAAAKLTQGKETPAVVFDCVSDPYKAAPVARSPTDKPANMTGIQALAPVEDALQLVKEIAPGAKRVGMIYNPAEANSELATQMAREAAPKIGLEIVDATVSKGDEVLTAAQALAAKKVDVFFVSTDSTVVASLESLVKVAQDSGIPLIGNDPDSAKRGAVAALGLDYADSGYQTGLQVVKILKGTPVRDIPIERQRKGFLAVNTAAATAQKVKLPDALLGRAQEKYDKIAPRP